MLHEHPARAPEVFVFEQLFRLEHGFDAAVVFGAEALPFASRFRSEDRREAPP